MLPAVRGGASYQDRYDFSQASETDASYITLADEITTYEALCQHPSFREIKTTFLKNIDMLKELAMHYVGPIYNQNLDSFKAKIITPMPSSFSVLITIYQHTRYHIHFIVNTLKRNIALEEEVAASSSADKPLNKDNLTFILHECLFGINLCLPGVYSRLMRAYHNLQAAQNKSASARIFSIKEILLKSCIQLFLLQEKQKNPQIFPIGNEVHVFNSLHNTVCHDLGLPEILDPLAPENFSDDFKRRFLNQVLINVNEAKADQTLAEECLEVFKSYLNKHNRNHWLTAEINLQDFNYDAEDLDEMFLDPMNFLFGTTGKENRLMLSTLLESKDEENYNFEYAFEKFLIWMLQAHKGCKGKALACKPIGRSSYQIIGSLNNTFFWVSNSSREIGLDQEVPVPENNLRSLTLQHLRQLYLNDWDLDIAFALLSQALRQTHCPQQIVDFFLGYQTSMKNICVEKSLITNIRLELRDKLIHCPPMAEEISLAAIQSLSKYSQVIRENILWLIETPILGKVLYQLKKKGTNISQTLTFLEAWEVLDFSAKELKKIFNSDQLKHFFNYAITNNITNLTQNLLLTQKCDSMIQTALIKGYNLLIIFSINNCAAGVKYLAKKSPSLLNLPDHQGKNALMHACIKGHAEVVSTLLKHSVKINTQNQEGITALMLSCLHRKPQIISLLLQYKADANIKDRTGNGILNLLAQQGYAEEVELLLQNKKTDINIKNQRGATALIIASKYGQKNITQLLLQYQANIEAKDAFGNNALIAACQYGNLEIAMQLLKHKANVNTKNHAGVNPLMMACRGGHTELIPELIKYQANLNLKADLGTTALMYACCYGHLPVVRLLLRQAEIEIDLKNTTDSTALMMACKYGREDIVALLLQHQANIQLQNNLGESALSIACTEKHTSLAVLLLRQGADINSQNKSAMTPLMELIVANSADIIQALLPILIKNSIKVNFELKDHHDNTLLSLAQEKANPEILACLEALAQAQQSLY